MLPRVEADLDDLYNRSYLASFSSVMIILLTFFVYFNSIAEKHALREEVVMQSLQSRFAPVYKPKSKQAERDFLASFAVDVYAPLNIESRRFGDTLFAAIPAKRLFYNGEKDLAADFLPMLESIAQAAKQHHCAVRAEVFAPPGPPAWDISLARTAALTRFFFDSNLPAADVLARGHVDSKIDPTLVDRAEVRLSSCSEGPAQ